MFELTKELGGESLPMEYLLRDAGTEKRRRYGDPGPKLEACRF